VHRFTNQNQRGRCVSGSRHLGFSVIGFSPASDCHSHTMSCPSRAHPSAIHSPVSLKLHAETFL